MDMSIITTLISNFGFPIFAFVMIFYYMIKEKESHKEEMTKVTEALNNNTIALNKLAERMGVNEDDR